MTSADKPFKAWMWNSNGTLVIGRLEVDSMAHAQFLAKRWNTEDPHTNRSMHIDMITNHEEHSVSTRVSAVY